LLAVGAGDGFEVVAAGAALLGAKQRGWPGSVVIS
jgi:hypothetical protein